MTDAELIESIDRHFLVCRTLSAVQLRDHEASGACPDCSERARGAARHLVKSGSERPG